MKLSSLLIIIVGTSLQLLMAHDTKSQNLDEVKVTLELKNETLKSAFHKIEQQTVFRFAYNKKEVDNYNSISLQKSAYTVQQVLEAILANTKLGFKTIHNNIVIFPEEEEKNNTASNPLPADGSIKGNIINEKGEPVLGASILLSGASKGTAANSAGDFTINNVKPGKYTLQVSAVGYQNIVQSITIADGQSLTLSFTLKENNSALNEVVVTGYTKQSKRDVTGAVSTISGDIVAKTPVTDVGSVLQGRVAGVSVDAQGDPGSVASVRIRGFGSNGNNDVLYVIDGVQMRGGSNLVNANDIETITVLKDPSITSLYGAQGGNGVVVITTKTGKRGTSPKLEYNAYGSWDSPTKYPKTLSPQQYANAYWNYLKNSNLAVSNTFYGSGATPVLPDYLIERTGLPVLAAAEGNPAANASLYNLSSYRILKANKTGTDWFHALLDQSFSHSHQLNVSGATDKANYSMGIGYLDNQGTLLGTYFKRYSFRVNTEFKPAKWLKLGENILFSYTQGSGVSNGNHNPQNLLADLYQRSPIIPIYDIAGNYSGPKDFADTRALHPGGNNPVMGQNTSRNNGGGYNAGLIGSAYVDIEPIKNLVFETRVGAQFYPYSFRFFIDTFPQNVFSATYNQFTEGGGYSSNMRLTNKLSYDIVFKSIHRISAFVAYESSKATSRTNQGTVTNLLYTTPGYLNLTNGTYNPVAPQSGSSGFENSTSVFGNINYTLQDKYLLSFVARRDGSSKFGPLNRYGNFFSYSGGWRISKESFMDKFTWINDLKLRAAYGENGNNAIPADLYEDRYTTTGYINYSSYDLNGTNNSAFTGAGLYQLGNPYIHWETNKTTNLGFDATLFKNRLNISFSWFNRVTKDLLAVPPITGLRGDALAPYENIMQFSNKGIELELGYNNKIGPVRYNMNFNIATYRNNVDYISSDPTAHIDGNAYAPTHFALTRSVVGKPVSSFFGLVEQGIFQSGDEYTKNGVTHTGLSATNAAGHFKFQDINNDKKINDDDRTFLGSPHPKFTYGYNLDLNYKNFDLGIFIQGVYGNKIFNYWRVNTVFPGAQMEGADNTWSPTNTSAKLPIWNSTTSDDIKPSSFFVESGSYLRLKSLQIGYTFPASKAFSKLRVYVQGYNLGTITKYTGIDPEISTGNATNAGVDFGGNYPISRKIVVGVNFGL
ncbi:MAG: TonB-dependent receptor [Chitinophagaceae bacterium]